MDLLFSSLQLYIAARAEGEDEAVPAWKTRWLVHEVADVLCWMASSEAPEKVVHFLTDNLQELVDLSVLPNLADNNCSSVNAVYWQKSAALVLVRKLIEPWVGQIGFVSSRASDKGDDSCACETAEVQAVRKLLAWAASTVSATLQAEHPLETQSEFVISSTAAIMGLQLDPSVSCNMSSGSSHNFVVYQEILRAVVASVAGLPGNAQGLQARENVLRNLHSVMQCRQFNDAIFVKCRAELVASVEAVSKVTTVAGTELQIKLDLIQNLATDIVTLF